MRALHAEGAKRGLGHDGLHDLAAQRWSVKSMGDATDKQLYGLYREWTGKGLRRRARPFAPSEKSQLVSKEDLIELAEQFAMRGWNEDTQCKFIGRQLKGREVVLTRGDLRKVLFAVRSMNKRDKDRAE